MGSFRLIGGLGPRAAWFACQVALSAICEVRAQDREFNFPKVDANKITTAGIRKLDGQRITIYTDLLSAAAVDELPRVFDAAVPLWCDYFNIEVAKLGRWRLIGCVMKDKSPFVAAGLYPSSLPDFPHGFFSGSQIWVYDQPSDYYRRHLVLHEGTHAFMQHWLGGPGPPWFMEGMAELLGTHYWQGGDLKLGVFPASRDAVPYWGRIKIVKDDMAAGRGKSLIDIMRYDKQAHHQVEAYGWCWAAAAFLDHHPLTQTAFRELHGDTRDDTLQFSKRFYDRVKNHWPAIVEDWQLFIAECDYGYDVPRASILRKPKSDLPTSGGTATLAADRGWQSTGYRLQAGKSYRISASGRYQIASTSNSWPCEPGGVTIRYANGYPLGMLLAGLGEVEADSSPVTPLTRPIPIGTGANFTPSNTGTLYLKINEPASGLADNSGSLSVKIHIAN